MEYIWLNMRVLRVTEKWYYLEMWYVFERKENIGPRFVVSSLPRFLCFSSLSEFRTRDDDDRIFFVLLLFLMR